MANSGFIKRIKSFLYAYKGFLYALKTQANFQIQIIVLVISMAAGFYFNIGTLEWLVLLLAIGIVISAELFNTAIEKILDFISPEYNKQAGLMKDIAAGAVLFSSIMAAIIGIIIFVPKIIERFFQ